MVVFLHELRQNRLVVTIWTLSIAFFLATCVMLFPQMKDSMGDLNASFSSMGAFTEAFGMDRLNFTTLIGFYGVECSNIIGIGGAFFAAMIGISSLSKEEKDHTVEFLLTHPISRDRVMAEKLLSLVMELVWMNFVVLLVAIASIRMIGEDIPWKEIFLLHGANAFLQLELVFLCFGISAFLKKHGFGIGLGIAIILYFLNLIANITEEAKFLKHLTPFGYADAADLVTEGKMDVTQICFGILVSVLVTLAGWIRYRRKDLP
ncbi:MAG: ABC transporter permease [Lachnospiraceae bacterium]|nr:ABC transporter permease [Lachnospiraceae bacterium]